MKEVAKAAFPWADFILNRNNWVQIGLAFPRERFHLELMLENCEGDVCIAGVQETSRRAEEANQPLLFKFRSLPIRIH